MTFLFRFSPFVTSYFKAEDKVGKLGHQNEALNEPGQTWVIRGRGI